MHGISVQGDPHTCNDRILVETGPGRDRLLSVFQNSGLSEVKKVIPLDTTKAQRATISSRKCVIDRQRRPFTSHVPRYQPRATSQASFSKERGVRLTLNLLLGREMSVSWHI